MYFFLKPNFRSISKSSLQKQSQAVNFFCWSIPVGHSNHFFKSNPSFSLCVARFKLQNESLRFRKLNTIYWLPEVATRHSYSHTVLDHKTVNTNNWEVTEVNHTARKCLVTGNHLVNCGTSPWTFWFEKHGANSATVTTTKLNTSPISKNLSFPPCLQFVRCAHTETPQTAFQQH